MPCSQPFYGIDLAYVHDVGYSAFAAGCAPGLLAILAQAGIRDGLVVDLGCGSGIWAKRLAEAGYQVVGLDIAPAMIELARQRVPSANFHVGSMWNHRIPSCRAVTALGEVVCYRSGAGREHHLRTLFRKVYRALEPGGQLIFDVAEIGLDRSRAPTFAEGDDWACLVQFEYDDTTDRLIRKITTFRRVGGLFRRSTERHVVQLYKPQQVAEWLRQTGFRVRRVRTFGAHPLLPKRVGFIAGKS